MELSRCINASLQEPGAQRTEVLVTAPALRARCPVPARAPLAAAQ